MESFVRKLNNTKMLYGAVFILVVVALVVYHWLFGFRPNNDTEGFLYLTDFFKGHDVPLFYNRYLNPFYAVVSAKLLFFLSAAHSLVVLNVIFFTGIAMLTCALIKRVFNSNAAGLVAALLVMTNYAVLRYGLTQVQDIGAFFWYVLTLYAGWRWWQEKKSAWLYFASTAVAFGLLTKESGAMGAVFVGVLLLLDTTSAVKTKMLRLLQFSLLPCVVLAINQWRGMDVAYNSKQWYLENWSMYFENSYTLFKWLGVNATTFNVLWLFAAYGVYVLVKNRRAISSEIKTYLAAVALPSLSYFAWPIFISRTVFIAAWLMIPLAVYGIRHLYRLGYRWMAFGCIVVGVLVPYVLQNMIGYTPLFYIIEQCRYQPACAWKTFVEKRAYFDDFRTHSETIISAP